MVLIEPWQNYTSSMVQQPSVRQKLTFLEDDLKNQNEPKNEDDLKVLTTSKVTQNPKYCDPFFTFVTLILTKSLQFLDFVTFGTSGRRSSGRRSGGRLLAMT